MATVFSLDQMRRVFEEAPVYEWEGTCELCSFPDRPLSDVGGVLCCDKCRNTITYRIKEYNHPFQGVRVAMDETQAGKGKKGERWPIGESKLSYALKQAYQGRLLANARGVITK